MVYRITGIRVLVIAVSIASAGCAHADRGAREAAESSGGGLGAKQSSAGRLSKENTPFGAQACVESAQTGFRYYMAGEVAEWLRVLRMLRRNDVDQAISYIEREPLGHKLSHLYVVDENVDLSGSLLMEDTLVEARRYRREFDWRHEDAEVEREIRSVLRQLDQENL